MAESGRSGTGGGACAGVRRPQIEPRRLCVLDTEFFLSAAFLAAGGFIERPESSLASHGAGFWGAVLGLATGARRDGCCRGGGRGMERESAEEMGGSYDRPRGRLSGMVEDQGKRLLKRDAIALWGGGGDGKKTGDGRGEAGQWWP